MNEFVSPQHRGVNLPPGCKDLMDVLKAQDALSAETPVYALHSNRRRPLIERHETNGLQHAEKFVRQLLESRSKMATLAFFIGRDRIAFSLVRFTNLTKAVFCFSKEEVLLERSICEVFARFGIIPLSDASVPLTQHRGVAYRVPDGVPGLLEVAGELLRRAFQVSDGAGLGFMLREQ